jgi:hypothetical protein
MSLSAKRASPSNRHRCSCGNHAVYRRWHRGGSVSARPDHPLCRRCWRSELDRARAAQARTYAWATARLVLPRGVVLPGFGLSQAA